MAEYTKQTRQELKDRAVALGLDVPSSYTKKDIYQAIMAHLREAISDIEQEPQIGFLTDDEADIAFSPLADAETIASGGHLRALPAAVETDETMRAWKEGDGLIEPVSTLPEMSRWEQMQAMSRVLCRSALMPRHIRDARDAEADCMVILLTAHDLGLTATLAFRKVHVIDGNPTLAAELMRLLIQRDGHDIKVNVTKDSDGKAVEAEMLIHRKEWADGDWRGDSFSLDDARTAGLLNKTNWKTHPKAMLIARATGAAARLYCADSLGGISYTPEELGAIDTEGEEVTPAVPAYVPVPAQPAVRAELAERISHIEDDEIRAELKVAWKSFGLGTLADGEHVLLDHQVAQATEMIAVAERADITDAEIVQDTPDPTLLPCEQDDDDVPDRVVDGVPDRGGPASVAASDPIDMQGAKQYAREMREKLDRAKETVGVPEGAVCDICHKPITVKNDGCASKAHAF